MRRSTNTSATANADLDARIIKERATIPRRIDVGAEISEIVVACHDDVADAVAEPLVLAMGDRRVADTVRPSTSCSPTPLFEWAIGALSI